ncbi:MAG: ATP-binding cassette domain-containing protein [Chloroflexi bacterium]|nr:ATP-binding cassette domain-containing protein [Chloroflexota bacterium]
MPDSQIEVENLTKVYHVPEREAGLTASVRSFFRRTYRDVLAVKGISFSIEAGEIVGFIGANGAGKTTTLKMLTGLLQPSSGSATIAGFTPWERQPAYLRRISMVMGNKSQMLWDIPPLDTFRVLGAIYGLSSVEAARTVNELVELLQMQNLLTKPVRNMSLGERMKCELTAALIHRPEVLFLDEPTIGLDVSAQRRLRQFIVDYNRQSGVTVMLTSHYMADVMELCNRVILIQQGKLIYDGDLAALSQQLAPFKLVRLTLNIDDPVRALRACLPPDAEILAGMNGDITLRLDRTKTAHIIAHLLNSLPVDDLSIENPPIEAVIDQIYQGEEVL